MLKYNKIRLKINQKMHAEFKEILIKISQKRPDPNRAEKDAVFQEKQRIIEENKSDLGLASKPRTRKSNIQNILNTYANLNKLSELILTYIESETNTISNHLDSGQCSDEEVIHYNLERNQLNSLWGYFYKKTEFFNQQSARFVSSRSFLQIISPSYDAFDYSTSKIEPNLYFLGDDFVRDAPDANRFKRIKLDLNNFNTLSELHLCASNPQQLCEFIKIFISSDSSENIAIACFEPRYAGFIIYPIQTTHAHQKLTELSKQHPNLLREDKEQGFWLLTLESNEIINYEFLTLFSTWFDADSLTIYRNENLFPIKINKNIPLGDFLNTDYELGVFFDYIFDPIQLNQTNIQMALNHNDPYSTIQNIEYYDGENYLNIKTEIFWTFSEILLIKYKLTENLEKLVFFNTISQTVVLEVTSDSFEAPMLQKLYSLNLELLNINCLETLNPRNLI